MLNTEELYFYLRKLKNEGEDLADISICVESSQNDEYFFLMKNMSLNKDSYILRIDFDDDRDEEE